MLTLFLLRLRHGISDECDTILLTMSLNFESSQNTHLNNKNPGFNRVPKKPASAPKLSAVDREIVTLIRKPNDVDLSNRVNPYRLGNLKELQKDMDALRTRAKKLFKETLPKDQHPSPE